MATTVTINETTEAVTVTISEGLLPGSNANQLGSGTATDGQVLTADGSGNTAWENLPAGADAWDSLTGTATKVPFNTSPSPVPTVAGSVYWNVDEQTLEIIQDASGNSISVGKEMKMMARNVSGSPIGDGLAVYVAGEASQRPSIELASVSNTTHVASTIGIASESIASPAFGKVTTQGLVNNINTVGLTAGQPLYLQENGTYNHTASAVRIGWCLVVGNGNGKIYVSVARMKWLSADITDSTDTPSTGKLIKWPSSGTLPPSSHTHVSSAITDATATPDAGKVALWGDGGTNWNQYAYAKSIAGIAPREMVFSDSTATGLVEFSDITYWTSSEIVGGNPTSSAAKQLPNSGDFVTIDNTNGYGYGTVVGRNVQAGGLFFAGITIYSDTCTLANAIMDASSIYCQSLEITGTCSFSATTIYGNVKNTAGADLSGCTIYGLVDGKLPTAKISDLAANRGPVLTGTPAEARDAIDAAMESEYKTASFTAAKSGRYHVKGSAAADGSVAVTDPTSPAPAAGDVYKVVIVSGYVRIGGADYFKSRHEITRHYTGSAWETLTPFFSDAPDYAAGVKETARGNLGAGATGSSLFTAATVGDVNTAMLRYTYERTTNLSRASTTTYAADTEIAPGNLKANTRYRGRLCLWCTLGAGGIKAKLVLPSLVADTLLTGQRCGTKIYWGQTFATSISADSTNNELIFLTDSASCTTNQFVGEFEFLTGATPGVASFQWAQNASNAANSTILAKSYLQLEEI